ncbi:hypothetical protein Glove_139g248 [Diversispora epigaea]|uniref:Uncharacterized protein n=1 Tax=Diversispora epigaea TaxID=1348612 RepID=A0A397J503_9GLOM|nr:hypothetical protein Glove_139g248 [Diversispora epigaea]
MNFFLILNLLIYLVAEYEALEKLFGSEKGNLRYIYYIPNPEMIDKETKITSYGKISSSIKVISEDHPDAGAGRFNNLENEFKTRLNSLENEFKTRFDELDQNLKLY